MSTENKSNQTHKITVALRGVGEGDAGAEDALLELVYSQLRKIAQNRMSRERDDHSLQATELVHEAYLKMADRIADWDWSDRGHFYRVAAEAMRRILIDYARAKGSAKRGSGKKPVVIDVLDLAEERDPDIIIAIDEAVQQLESEDAHLGQVVRLRFYAGLSVDETANAMGLSKRSVIRYWTFARAWLYENLEQR